MSKKSFVKDWKKKKVEDLAKIIKEYHIIGVANLENMPSKQLQMLRAKIRDEVLILVSKKSFFRLALEKAGHKDLVEKLSGMPALLLTNINPFKLNKILERNTSPAPIKAGQIAPTDLVVPEGDTPFTAGPIIGELAEIGVKAKIDKGKIVVIRDSLVVKKGEPVGELASSILLRLGIEPMEFGLNLVCAKEDKLIYPREVLHIDEEEFITDLLKANSEAVSLALDIGYFTKQTIELLLTKAHNQMRSLVLDAGVFVPAMVKELLTKASANSTILKRIVAGEPVQETKDEASSETKTKEEEKKEDVTEEAAGLAAIFG